jgi:hypothetical protein
MQCGRRALASRAPAAAAPTARKPLRFKSSTRSVAVNSLREDDHSLLRQLCGPGAAVMLLLLQLHLTVLLLCQDYLHQATQHLNLSVSPDPPQSRRVYIIKQQHIMRCVLQTQQSNLHNPSYSAECMLILHPFWTYTQRSRA